MQDEVMLEAVRRVGEQWQADLSFRGKAYQMTFQADRLDRLRPFGQAPFHWTVEGHAVGCLVERVRRGEPLALPQRVEPGPEAPKWPSVYDPRWNPPPLNEAWLESAKKVGERRWQARLRLDGRADVYEIDILPGDGIDELRTPENPMFGSYKYDLMNLLVRMHEGERFALPFKLRPRWPTPPDPPALPS